jgi:hypothetical protein
MAQSDSGDESLESRLNDYCKRFGCTTDEGEYVDLDELIEELATTVDELRPVIERGLAQKTLAGRWFKGEQRFAITTPTYLAERDAAAQRVSDVLDEFVGVEPAAKKMGKPGTKKTGKPSKEKTPRLTWRYAPVPLAIIDDRSLSAVAVRVAAIIARSINLGKWNQDLYAKLTYADLAEGAGVSRATAARALDDLKAAGHIHVESLTRGGCRITFQQSHS